LQNSTNFIGELEAPLRDHRVSDSIDISGWVYSRKGRIASIEALIDGIPVGTLAHGQPRPDVSAYPSRIPIDCGYSGILAVDEAWAGSHELIVRVTDTRGHTRYYHRTLSIERHRTVAGSGRGSHSSTISALLRDDLSIAKRLQTTVATISLQSFLVSNSVIRFAEVADPEISIILVLHNRAELTLLCLDSLLKLAGCSFEVLIVDNASTDQTRQLLERVEGARIIQNEQNLHYVLACNQASKVARGKHLLLLNNDTQIQAHSVSAALATLNSSEDIGAVGGKVILADGTLQEAGSIVWSDGSCLGYGRGGSPLEPRFMFRRDVDYCSAVFLLTPRDLFLTAGGFDEAYLPAYYEEVDYCAKLWQQGKRVIYDPDVTVFHHEFASSSSTEAAIDWQARHRDIFATRQSDWLQSQLSPSAANVLVARSRFPKKTNRILMLDDRVPHRSLGSGFPRSNLIVREMLRLGHHVTFYPLAFREEDWFTVYEDLPREIEVMKDQGLPRLEQFLNERMGYYDIVFVSRPHNMAHLRPLLQQKPELFNKVKIIYDAEALFSLRNITRAQLERKRISSEQQQKLIDEEIKLTENCDRVVSVSEREGAEFSRRGIAEVFTLGHALDPAPGANGFAERKDILFVGAIHEIDSPNADSVIWFSSSVLPLIQKALRVPVNLIIAGVMHPGVEEQLDRKSVQIKGVVKDLAGLYDECRLFVAPTRFSAGVPLKIYEASAHGLPVVATTLAGSQLGWQDGEDLLLANDKGAFANSCIRLYQDEDLWKRLRGNALKRVVDECSLELFSARLKTIID
ncbi:MAG TPA: glycosyltransferase, partial [Pyrinomonadaceae bacterium]|nr:glycosyltransferase [Pyrinomonadaceae bacterium]